MTISNEIMAEARSEVAIAAGELVPEFVQVPDGHYTHGVVLTETLTAATTESPEDPTPIDYEVRPLETPLTRYRTELQWVPIP